MSMKPRSTVVASYSSSFAVLVWLSLLYSGTSQQRHMSFEWVKSCILLLLSAIRSANTKVLFYHYYPLFTTDRLLLVQDAF